MGGRKGARDWARRGGISTGQPPDSSAGEDLFWAAYSRGVSRSTDAKAKRVGAVWDVDSNVGHTFRLGTSCSTRAIGLPLDGGTDGRTAGEGGRERERERERER